MKLEAEPRAGAGAPAWMVEWMRRVAAVFNNGDDAATALAARVTAAEAAVAAAGITGEFKFFALGGAPTGWVAGNGSTIGNVGSGATLASATTQALFSAWWAAYSDAQLPILTSAGAASTRGANAAADWAAGKRLTVFDVRDRFIRSSSATYVNGTKYAGSEVFYNGGNSGLIIQPLTGGGMAALDATGSVNTFFNSVAGTVSGVSTPVQTGAIRPVNIALLGCFKL